MKNQLRISVAIPSYNRPSYLVQTIKEVLAQNHPAVHEIIIVDQTPDDNIGTEDKQQLQDWHSKKLIRYQKATKPNANTARNICLSNAKGEIILMLDDDVLLPDLFVDQHYKWYSKSFHDKTPIAVAGKSYHRKNAKIKEDSPLDKINFKEYTEPDFSKVTSCRILSKGECLVGCNMSFLKSHALAIGGFDEQLQGHYDEADFSFRLKKVLKTNETIMVNPDAYLIHFRAFVGGQGHREKPIRKEYENLLSCNLFCIRHYTGLPLILKLIANLRIGPLRKDNFGYPGKMIYSTYCYIRSIVNAYALRHKIKSSLTE